MAEVCESSGLHSLASLREHEKKRAQQQADAARARAEAEQRARHDAERLEFERRSSELRAREQAESAQRAELKQLQAAQRAEFERAEGLALAGRELQKELECERLARRSVELGLTSRLLRQRLWTNASSALALAGGVAAIGLYFGALRPNTEREVATARTALLAERKVRSEAEQREARSRLRIEELSAQLGSVEQALHAEREQRATPPAPSALRRPVTHESLPVKPVSKPCRDDGDPLNPCLKR
ncbi:MAG TPA: hypothetical protein VER12_10595 [Polyangiaceae bacterium]|nr:hypothetical protein [Polyangiaceae bacterium]